MYPYKHIHTIATSARPESLGKLLYSSGMTLLKSVGTISSIKLLNSADKILCCALERSRFAFSCTDPIRWKGKD